MNLKQLRGTAILLLTACIWGFAFVAQSVGADYVGPFTFLACRTWLAWAVLLPVTLIMDRKKAREGAQAETTAEKRTLLLGGTCCGVFLFLASITQQIGIPLTTTAKAGFITALYVVIVPILTIFMGRRVGGKIWISVALGVIGLYLLCMVDSFSLSRGDAIVLLCAFLYACQILSIDHFAARTDGIHLTLLQFFVTSVLSTIGMFVFEQPSAEAIWAAGLPILYAGVLSSGVGFTLQTISQKEVDPAIASLTMSLESVFSALAGWLLLKQALSTRELMGCVLMFTAIVIVQLPERRKRGGTTAQ